MTNWKLGNPNYFNKYRKENFQKRKDYNKKWAQENKEKLLLRIRNYRKRLRQTSSSFRVLNALRCRMYDSIINGYKSKSTMELIGCDIAFLIKYLESLFQKDMTWENYGFYGWHIDHIKPCSSFDLTDPAQQKECFNYKNLQPLWAQDNYSKGDKVNKFRQKSEAQLLPIQT
jgi:hypothetical protein